MLLTNMGEKTVYFVLVILYYHTVVFCDKSDIEDCNKCSTDNFLLTSIDARSTARRCWILRTHFIRYCDMCLRRCCASDHLQDHNPVCASTEPNWNRLRLGRRVFYNDCAFFKFICERERPATTLIWKCMFRRPWDHDDCDASSSYFENGRRKPRLHTERFPPKINCAKFELQEKLLPCPSNRITVSPTTKTPTTTTRVTTSIPTKAPTTTKRITTVAPTTKASTTKRITSLPPTPEASSTTGRVITKQTPTEATITTASLSTGTPTAMNGTDVLLTKQPLFNFSINPTKTQNAQAPTPETRNTTNVYNPKTTPTPTTQEHTRTSPSDKEDRSTKPLDGPHISASSDTTTTPWVSTTFPVKTHTLKNSEGSNPHVVSESTLQTTEGKHTSSMHTTRTKRIVSPTPTLPGRFCSCTNSSMCSNAVVVKNNVLSPVCLEQKCKSCERLRPPPMFPQCSFPLPAWSKRG